MLRQRIVLGIDPIEVVTRIGEQLADRRVRTPDADPHTDLLIGDLSLEFLNVIKTHFKHLPHKKPH